MEECHAIQQRRTALRHLSVGRRDVSDLEQGAAVRDPLAGTGRHAVGQRSDVSAPALGGVIRAGSRRKDEWRPVRLAPPVFGGQAHRCPTRQRTESV